jgi:hypothetical protein
MSGLSFAQQLQVIALAYRDVFYISPHHHHTITAML